jgi:copper chaperone CopZ
MNNNASSEAAPATFAVLGMIDRSAIDAIKAAVRAVDPTASVKVSLGTGLVSVQSAAAAELIQRAIETQGFIAEKTARPFPIQPAIAGPKIRGRAALHVVGRAFLIGLLCAFAVPCITFAVVLVSQHFDPACGTPADSGGCEMGLVSTTVLSIAPGALIGFSAALVDGFARLARSGM